MYYKLPGNFLLYGVCITQVHSGPDRLENRFLIDAVPILDDFDGIGVFWSPEFGIDVAVALGQPSQPGSVT